MSSRGIESSGGDLHVRMVRIASHYIIENFNLKSISLDYEVSNFDVEVKINSFRGNFTGAEFKFRPDIVVGPFIPVKENKFVFSNEDGKGWAGIQDSHSIIVEVETNPRKLLSNDIKKVAYANIKSVQYDTRKMYAFVLVTSLEHFDYIQKLCHEASDHYGYYPFDEVWFIDMSEVEVEDTDNPILLPEIHKLIWHEKQEDIDELIK